LRLSQLLL
jgi:hypothetical protein